MALSTHHRVVHWLAGFASMVRFALTGLEPLLDRIGGFTFQVAKFRVNTQVFELCVIALALTVMACVCAIVLERKDTGSAKSNRPIVGIAWLALAFLATWGASHNFVSSGNNQKPACIENLRRIEAAMSQYAHEHDLPAGTPIGKASLEPYLKGNQLPDCPSGGIYSIKRLGEHPTCTVEGHNL